MSDEPNIQDLLRQGIEAARAGDRARARELFEQVVELDDQNEKAWFWMASVVDTDEEKRASLNNVLYINPDNERARAALEKMGAAPDDEPSEDEVIPGVTRRQLLIFGGGGAAAVVLILLIVVIIISINSGRERRAAALQAQIALEQTQGVLIPTTQAAALTATQFAIATPTNTPTDSPLANAPTLPPSWTPTDAPTTVGEAAAAAVLDAPPLDVLGEIVAWGGRDVQNIGFLPILLFPANQLSTEGTTVGDELGREPKFNGDRTRIAYTRYFPTTFDFGIELINPNGTVPTDPGRFWRETDLLLEVQDPSLSDDGCVLAFTALPPDLQAHQLYILNLCAAQAAEEAEPSEDEEQGGGEEDGPVDNPFLSRISTDEAFYADAVISGDGSRIAVIRDDRNGANPGADLIVIDVVSGQITAITNDFGAFIESSPDWSPDGVQLVYAAAASTAPDNNDIFVKQSNGSGQAIPVVRGETDDILPVYGPNGQYVAFARNTTGAWQIYLQDINAQVTFQVTNTGEDTFPGDWEE